MFETLPGSLLACVLRLLWASVSPCVTWQRLVGSVIVNTEDNGKVAGSINGNQHSLSIDVFNPPVSVFALWKEGSCPWSVPHTLCRSSRASSLRAEAHWLLLGEAVVLGNPSYPAALSRGPDPREGWRRGNRVPSTPLVTLGGPAGDSGQVLTSSFQATQSLDAVAVMGGSVTSLRGISFTVVALTVVTFQVHI